MLYKFLSRFYEGDAALWKWCLIPVLGSAGLFVFHILHLLDIVYLGGVVGLVITTLFTWIKVVFVSFITGLGMIAAAFIFYAEERAKRKRTLASL